MKKEQFNYDFDPNYVDTVAEYTLRSLYLHALVRTAILGRSYDARKNLSIVRQMVRNPHMVKNVDFGNVFNKLFGENTGRYSCLDLYKKYLGDHHENGFYRRMYASYFVGSASLIARIRARSSIGR